MMDADLATDLNEYEKLSNEVLNIINLFLAFKDIKKWIGFGCRI